MFFIALAADIDPDDFAWLVFTRSTKMRLTGYNQRHSLTLEKGDIFGVRRTRSNTYQLVKSDQLHVLYRNIPVSTHERILKHSIAYKGEPITMQEVEEGFTRRRRVATREKAVANKRTDDFYRAPGKIVEKFELDLADYQWRRVSKTVKVLTKKQGRVKTILRPQDIVGVRYMTAAKGGYVVVDGNVRVHVSHENYSEIIHSAKILPASQQRDDIVDLETGTTRSRKAEPKKVERRPVARQPRVEEEVKEEVEELPQLYDLEDLDEEQILELSRKSKRRNNNLRRRVRKLMSEEEAETWVDDEGSFEDDEPVEDDETEAPDEAMDDETEAAPEQDDSAEPEAEDDSDDLDDDDLDDDDGLDDDDLDDDDLDDDLPDATYRADDRVADVLEPGTQFSVRNGHRTFVVVVAEPMERNANIMEYLLHDPEAEDDSDFRLFRLRLNVNMDMKRFSENAEVLEEEYDEQKLKDLQGTIDYADIKSVSLVK